MSYKTIPIEKILFLDIETVPNTDSFENLSEDMQMLWDKKSSTFRTEEQTAEEVYQRAGIYAEFGRIVCISVGYIKVDAEGIKTFYSKSFAGEDECLILSEFSKLIEKNYSSADKFICGHNIKEFDMPYIARRMLINGLPLPSILDIAGKKPWEVSFLDTLELWKFGDYKNYTSLNLLTHIFGIPTPKDDIDGSQVASVFYNEHDINRISVYCEKDILATAQVFLRFRGETLIPQENIVHRD